MPRFVVPDQPSADPPELLDELPHPEQQILEVPGRIIRARTNRECATVIIDTGKNFVVLSSRGILRFGNH